MLSPTRTTQKGFPALQVAGFHTLLLSLAPATSFFGLVSPIQQLTDEKTCMQFSIRRPKLPSSETHPEENTYRRLDVSAWLRHLNESGQGEEEYKLQKVRGGCCRGGCCEGLLSCWGQELGVGESKDGRMLPGWRSRWVCG